MENLVVGKRILKSFTYLSLGLWELSWPQADLTVA